MQQRPLYITVARGASGLNFVFAVEDNPQLASVGGKTKIRIASTG